MIGRGSILVSASAASGPRLIASTPISTWCTWAQTFTPRNEGGIVGFHGGAQWQWGPWVIGLEVAYSKGWRDISGTVSPSLPELFTTLGAYNNISSLLTAGPRLGYAWDCLFVRHRGLWAAASTDNMFVLPPAWRWPPGTACGIFGPVLADLNATVILETTAVRGRTASNTWRKRPARRRHFGRRIPALRAEQRDRVLPQSGLRDRGPAGSPQLRA